MAVAPSAGDGSARVGRADPWSGDARAHHRQFHVIEEGLEPSDPEQSPRTIARPCKKDEPARFARGRAELREDANAMRVHPGDACQVEGEIVPARERAVRQLTQLPGAVAEDERPANAQDNRATTSENLNVRRHRSDL